MALAVKDSFLDLERHRQMLEENIEKLRKSLRHWQTWEAEYEGLKEEILSANPTPNREQLLAIGRAYEGDLVNKKEVDEILGVGRPRSAAQVVNLLDRRLDYVEQNVRTVQKQITTAEEKLAAASIISTPEVRNEEGLPVTEIVEELDEEGNIISSHLTTPGSAKPQLLEVLKKAGITDLPADTPLDTKIPLPDPKEFSKPESSSRVQDKIIKPQQIYPKSTKKGVSFAEDTKPGPEPEKSQTAKRLEDIMKLAKQAEAKPTEPPVIPKDESPEDAALRREMLQYGMSEVGAVVAELELEEGSDWTEDDYEVDDASSVDDEDAFGRSTGKVVTDEIRQRMIDLEERLGVRAMENIGKKASDYNVVDEGIGRVTISQPDSAASQNFGETSKEIGEKGISAKKSVRFSEELDISPAPEAPKLALPTREKVAPVSDIIERSAPVQAAVPTPQKQSRFKAARSKAPNVVNGPLASSGHTNFPLYPATPSTPKPFSTSIQFSPAADNTNTVPTGPEGRTLAPTVVERDVAVGVSASAPDEFDPHLLNQEVATEYHKMRNRMIQRQGGFLKEEESEIVPFTEEEGGPKKVSRFKAARLARS